MRHSPIVFASLRVATTDIELDDVLIPASAFVPANTAAANRDPAVYDHPDRLDITREGPAPMLTFGGGAHYCLGAHLARVEPAEALRVITAKMSNARRTGSLAHCRNHARSAASGSSGVWLRGRWRWVARCCPVTRQANRSLTCITAIR
jgi:cytochrome P450